MSLIKEWLDVAWTEQSEINEVWSSYIEERKNIKANNDCN